MYIYHKSGHCQIKKLVVSAAINQAVQNLLSRLMRVDGSSLACSNSYLFSSSLPWEPISSSPDRIRGGGRSSRRYPPSPCRSLLYTPSYAAGDLHANIEARVMGTLLLA